MGTISNLEKAVLEIGSGAWFITAASLVFIFGYYVVQRVCFDPDWRRSPTVRAAAALVIFGAGSSIRAGLAWYRFANDDYEGSNFILAWWPWFEASIILNAVGASAAVYVLAPTWPGCLAAGTVLAAFVVPMLIYLT